MAGVAVAEPHHVMTRRMAWHDYSSVGTYMLTLVVSGRQPLLGVLCGTVDEARIELTPLGKAILNGEVNKIPKYYPMVEVWKVCVMPDHIHMILRVKEPMPGKKHLGHVVSGFKAGCSQAWWRLQDEGKPAGEPAGTGAAPKAPVPAPVPDGSPSGSSSGSPSGSSSGVAFLRPVLFEKGYCDKILLRDGQLDNWKRYLDDNPRRLAVKRQQPAFFTVCSEVRIGEWNCQMIGNRFLLDIPDKCAIIVHRAYTDTEFLTLRQEWLACGEAGGVLVGTGIAPREKQVMREALDRGYRIILLREHGFPPLYKPSGRAFDACAAEQLLMVSPWPFHMERRVVSREQCLLLNRMAEWIEQKALG